MKKMMMIAGLALLSTVGINAMQEATADVPAPAKKTCKLKQLVKCPKAQAAALGAIAGMTAAKCFHKEPKVAGIIGGGTAVVYYFGLKGCSWAANKFSKKAVAPVAALSVPAAQPESIH